MPWTHKRYLLDRVRTKTNLSPDPFGQKISCCGRTIKFRPRKALHLDVPNRGAVSSSWNELFLQATMERVKGESNALFTIFPDV